MLFKSACGGLGWQATFHLMRFIFVLLILSHGSVSAAAIRPRLGLALSGGGSRGLAHIGVLKGLEKLHIPVDFISGTSMGAVVGALYAAGYSIAEMEAIVSETDWEDLLFNDKASRRELPLRRKVDHGRYLFDFELGYRGGRFLLPSGLVHGQKLSLLLDSLFSRVATIQDFSKLPIAYSAVGVDAESGKLVVLDRGNLADAVRASAAYPGFFSPVEIDGRLLLDGGAVNNLPVDVVKKMGADDVIAVDISSPLLNRSGLSNFVDVSDQFVTILMRKTLKSQMDQASVVLVPEMPNDGSFSYANLDQLIRSGEESVDGQRLRLEKYRLSEKSYGEWQKAKKRELFKPEVVDSIQIQGFRRVDFRTIETRLSIKEGDLFDEEVLKEDLGKIYSLGDFERADFAWASDRGKNVLSIRAIEKRWGPNYIHFGVTWDGEIKGKRDGEALMNIQLTRLNRLNADWVTNIRLGSALEIDTEFYQPLDYGGHFFLAPRGSALRMYRNFYQDKSKVASYEVDAFAGEFDLGIDFKKYGEIRGGIRRGYLNSESELATASIPSFSVQTASFVGRLKIDQLDSAYFPSRGFYWGSEFLSSKKFLGADYAYQKLSMQVHGFYSLGRHTVFLSALGGGNLGTGLPVYDEFLLGGFRSLSGFREEELRGQGFGVGRSGYLFKLPAVPSVFWSRIYLGLWGEIGNTFNSRSEIDSEHLRYAGTVAAGLDTKLGPVFLAYGQSGREHRQFYISVGRTFGIQSEKIF